MRCEECGESLSISATDRLTAQRFEFEPQQLCFTCNQRQRLYFRGERSLYRRTCDSSGENVISVYSPDKPFPVYKSDHWYSDRWDALSYGREYDFSRPFFEQLAELQHVVPRLALSNVKGENSEYCHSTVGNKNCYLLFGGDENEDCMYGTLCMRNVMTLDVDYSNRNQWCYMLSDSNDCYECQFVFDSNSCSNCAFISNCTGCDECLLSTNLVKKSYYIRNTPYSKKEYFEKKQALLNGSYREQQALLAEFLAVRLKRIVKFAHMIGCENCTGDYLANCKNCAQSFEAVESEDLIDIIFGDTSKNCFNSSMLGEHSELCYNTVSTYGAYNIRSSFFIIHSSNVDYSDMCINSKDLFGCVGLRNKQFCILNRQYPEAQYQALRKRIIEQMRRHGEWGRFFPKSLSCFDFTESSAYKYFPLDQAEAKQRGYRIRTEQNLLKSGTGTNVPDVIGDVTDDIMQNPLSCTKCARQYKILPTELRFYRRLGIPVPRTCSDCRHAFRISQRNPAKLWNRTCKKCNTDIITTYAPERPEQVYCEPCYQGVVF